MADINWAAAVDWESEEAQTAKKYQERLRAKFLDAPYPYKLPSTT